MILHFYAHSLGFPFKLHAIMCAICNRCYIEKRAARISAAVADDSEEVDDIIDQSAADNA